MGWRIALHEAEGLPFCGSPCPTRCCGKRRSGTEMQQKPLCEEVDGYISLQSRASRQVSSLGYCAKFAECAGHSDVECFKIDAFKSHTGDT